MRNRIERRVIEPAGPGVYSLADLCRLFTASAPTVRKAVADGTIPKPLKLGTKQVWPRAAIDALLGGRTARATETAATR